MFYVITSNSPRQNKSKMLCLVSSKGAVHKIKNLRYAPILNFACCLFTAIPKIQAFQYKQE